MGPEISKMLKGLNRFDPETYKRFYKTLNSFAGSHNLEISVVQDILKSELQEAIASRKDNDTIWMYKISPLNNTGKCLARISRIIGKYPNKKREYYIGNGDSPAEALLSAYLMALKGRNPYRV